MTASEIQCFGVDAGQKIEICNGVDDDCDGQLDKGITEVCYDGQPSDLTASGTVCRSGIGM